MKYIERAFEKMGDVQARRVTTRIFTFSDEISFRH